MIKDLEGRIEAIQDKLDVHNSMTEIWFEDKFDWESISLTWKLTGLILDIDNESPKLKYSTVEQS
jgi:hypothetical protein